MRPILVVGALALAASAPACGSAKGGAPNGKDTRGTSDASAANDGAGAKTGEGTRGTPDAPSGPGMDGTSTTPTGFAAECARLGLTATACEEWSRMGLPDTLPPSRGNRFAEDPSAAELGFELFFDLNALSPDDIRCAGCHAPEHAFSNNVALPTGSSIALRNALSLVNAARNYPHFWDGRADSLWSQSLLTIENPDEMRGTRLAVAQRVARSYRPLYEKAFGPMPDLTGLPAQGKPGSPEWETMSKDDQSKVSRVYVNVGKSFEAYLRKIAAGRSPLDRFIAGDSTAISDSAKQGLRIFTESGCLSCHSGPNFTDGEYHALDVPLPSYAPYAAKSATDRGRAQGLTFLLASEFNAKSDYYDRAPGEAPRLEEDVSPVPDGMFLTPSLRNVGDTAPYTHNGAFGALRDVVRFILKGGGPNCVELAAHDPSDDDVANVVAFLSSLHGDTAPLPWSTWPQIGSPTGAAAYDAGSK